MKKWIQRIIFILILIVIVMVSVLGYQKLYKDKKPKQEEDVIVKENVKVITSDMDKKKKPINVNDDNLVFESNPKYKEGDVIVAGEISGAEDGFIRKVVSVKKTTGGYVVETQSALLTDVFEKAYIEKRLKITKDGVQEVSNNVSRKDTDKAVETVQMMSVKMEKNYSVTEMADKKKDSSSSNVSETQDDSKSKENDNEELKKEEPKKEEPKKEEPESEYDFGKAFEETIDNVTISGDMGIDLEVELMLDINHGNIKYGMAMYRKAGANLSVDLKESMSKEYEKQLFEKKIPNYTFVVAGVPIVITNQLESNLTGKIGIEGNWNMSLSWLDEQTVGFIYDSKTNKVKEIKDPKEQKDISDGIEWSTIASAKGDASAGIDIHLITKLYGTCGGDISAGIFGNASGEVSLSNREDQYYAGTVNLSIVPNLTGKLVVDLPLVSEELMEVEIFNKDLPAIWEKKWKSSWNPEDDLNYSDTGEQWNLYKTRYGETYNIDAQEFQFKIPLGWNVESEEIGKPNDEIMEKVALSNDRGITVTFWSLAHELGGRSGVSMLQADITKADDSEFIPSFPNGTNTDFSSLGNFIVAKVHIIGELDMKRDSDFTPVDSGATFYAVVPESYLGTREFVGQAGNVDEFSFDYPTPYAFIAESPDGTFTVGEERDVVKILKSFKVAE